MRKISRDSVRRMGIMAGVIAVFSLAGPIAYLEFQDWFEEWTVSNSQVAMIGPDNPPSVENFAPEEQVPEAPPITEFKIVSADEITDEIQDDELVLGVVVEGRARAYSINIMTGPQREIFNDMLAGHPIAATW